MPAPKASSKNNGQGVTTLAITVPATTAAGDLILIRASTNANTTITHNGSNYTTVQDGTGSGSTSGILISKIAVAGDASSVVTFTYGVSNRVSGICVIMASGSFDPTNPIRPTPTFVDTTTDTATFVSPAITAEANSTILVWDTMQGATGAGAITWTAPSGTTLVTTASSTAAGGKNNAQGVSWTTGSGASGPYSATVSQVSAGRASTIAVAPVPPDPGLIATSTAATATAYSNQRKIDRTSNGVLWAIWWDGLNGDVMPMAYSTDDGATWNSAIFPLGAVGSSYVPNISLFIDQDDYAHVVWKSRSDGYIYYSRGTPNASRTAWTWSGRIVVWNTNTYADCPDIVAHREGTGWVAHVLYSYNTGTYNTTLYNRMLINSSGIISLSSGELPPFGNSPQGGQISGTNYASGKHTYPSIDFNHIGDGKTVAGGTPHLYAAWSAGNTGTGKGIRFKKATYSAGAWTWGTEREIDNTRYISTTEYSIDCMFDGTRVVIACPMIFNYGAGEAETVLYERDSADTTTTPRVFFAGFLLYGSSTHDEDGNIYLFGSDGSGGAGGDVRIYRMWDRASNELGPAVSISVGNRQAYISAKRGYSGNKIEFIYTDGTASPYSVKYGSIAVTPPGPQVSVWDGVIEKVISSAYIWNNIIQKPITFDALIPPAVSASVSYGPVAAGSTASTINISQVPGMQVGDLIVIVNYQEVTGAQVDATGTFTKLFEANNWGGGIHTMTVWWKRVTASEPAWQFTPPSSTWVGGQAMCISGALASGSPFRQTPASATADDTTSANSPAVALTAVPANDILIWAGTNYQGPTITGPAGYTLAGTSSRVAAMGHKIQTATGDTGNVVATWGTAAGQVAFLVSVKPA